LSRTDGKASHLAKMGGASMRVLWSPPTMAAPYGLSWGGDVSDKPVPGDYDGDGKTDIPFIGPVPEAGILSLRRRQVLPTESDGAETSPMSL
jgi:hypothetical protein